jgi:hypothetical protein
LEARSQGIPHEVHQIIYYIHMDFSSTLQDENLFEESSGRNEYKD